MENLIELLRWATVFLLAFCITADKIYGIHNKNRKGFTSTKNKSKSKHRNRQVP